MKASALFKNPLASHAIERIIETLAAAYAVFSSSSRWC